LFGIKYSWTKNAFCDVINKKWRKWFFFNDTHGLLFMFVRSIYRLFVLNRSSKRDSLQMMIFVNVCSTWSMVQLKTRFETSITRNDINCVSMFNLCYLITLMTYLWSQRTQNVQFKYFMFDCSIQRLFVLNTCWKRDSLQMMIFVNVCSTWSMVQLITRFGTSVTRNDVNGVSLFHLSYLITLIATCAHNGHQMS
jgi:hypothetical protein